jgi:hypothetical protein
MKNTHRNITSTLASLIADARRPRIWTLNGSDGQPDFFRLLRRGHHLSSSTARGIDLFTTLAGAAAWINQTHDDGDPVLIATEMTVTELLVGLARADVAAIDRRDFALTKRGALALERAEPAAPIELLAALTGSGQT